MGKCWFRVALFVAMLAAIWMAPSQQAQAKPVEYVKVCSLYGAGFYYIPGTDSCLRVNSIPTLREGTICGYGGGTYFTDGATCPSRPAQIQSAYRCGVMGPGVYADTRSLCRSNQVFDTRTQTEYGTLRTYVGSSSGIDIGISGGANIYSPSTSFLRGFDSLAVPALRTDQRDIGLGSTSAMFGVDVNAWRTAPSFLPVPAGTRIFAQASFMFPISSSVSETVTGVNAFPKGTVTTEYKSDYQIGLFGGVSYDMRSILGAPNLGLLPNVGMLANPRLRLAGGGVFNNHKITVSGIDTSGVAFNSSRSSTDFEPGFLVGIKGDVGGFSAGVDVINTFPCFFSTTAQSGFPSQTYKGAVDGGVNTTVKFTVAKQVWAGN
jgi:hypothetical protein